MKPLEWPPRLDARLRALWAEGLTFAQMALKLKRKAYTIGYRARKLGLFRIRPLTTSEVRVMQALRDQGLTLQEIARETGRDVHTILEHTKRRGRNGKTRPERGS